MNILVFTNMYPYPAKPYYGIFVKEQVESLKKMGVSIDVLFINGEISKFNYIKSFKEFFNTISKNHYDIVHCHHTYCGFIATFQRKAPIVLTFHEGEIFSGFGVVQRIRKYGLWKILLFSTIFKRFVLNRVNYVISVTEDLDSFVTRDKLSVIPPGVNLNLFRPMSMNVARRKLHLPLDKKMVLFPADPKKRGKRFDLAKQTIDNLIKEGMDILLITLGNVKYEDVPYYMNAADVVLFTSDYEASPMVIKEAMACNIPIVSTDTGDTKHTVGNIQRCFICNPSPHDMTRKIKIILNSNERTKGRKRIKELELELDSIAEKTLNTYNKLV